MRSTIKSVISSITKITAKHRTRRSHYSQFLNLLEAYKSGNDRDISNKFKEFIGTTSDISHVMDSMDEFFDRSYYISIYQDVKIGGLDPYYHYLIWGWKEHRTPSRFFDPNFYRERNDDMEDTEFPLAHFQKHGRDRKISTHPVSDRIWFQPTIPDAGTWKSLKSAKQNDETRAVVVIPVYKGVEETLTCIWHAISSRKDSKYSILVVNDAGPDSKLNTILEDLAKDDLFDYHKNPHNLGFVRTINLALEHLTRDIDVILLNSDAYVFDGWFERFIRHADTDPEIATITPLSNNATICSYPTFDADNFRALELRPDAIDRIAGSINKGIALNIPTGVGFCFYMRRSAIRKIGGLDSSAFPLGYGEENDFCMRARLAGLKNVLACDVFVYHTGSVSFSEIKDEQFRRGQEALQRKHPNYNALVKHHVAADPERSIRRSIDAERLVKAFTGAALIVTHRWSGGIETYLKQVRLDMERQGKKCLFLRVHDRHRASLEGRVEQEIFLPNLADLDLRTELPFLIGLLERLQPTLVHVNSFAGLEWSYQRTLLEILGRYDAPRVYIGHDYAPISHHYQLLRPDNTYVGLPTLDALVSWDLMKPPKDTVDLCHPAERQLAYRNFFEKGTKVCVPSETTRAIYQNYFPGISIEVVPHQDNLPTVTRAPRPHHDQITKIAIVGAIGPHKGSDVVAALAEHARNGGLPLEYHLIGYSDDDERLRSAGVNLWGRYRSDAEALSKLGRLGPHLCLIPSIWPETFCYTLSLCLKKGIPTLAFDLGAQRERLKTAARGHTFPLSLADQPARLSDAILDLDVKRLWEKEDVFFHGA